MGGALGPLTNLWTDYVPIYRTAVGTGIGAAFGVWT